MFVLRFFSAVCFCIACLFSVVFLFPYGVFWGMVLLLTCVMVVSIVCYSIVCVCIVCSV